MNQYPKSLLLIVVMAVPAVAHGAFTPKDAACFASGTASYQFAAAAGAPDFRVRIGGEYPDLRMRLVDRPEIADFVLVDDVSAGQSDACRAGAPIQTVKLDAETPSPDVTVRLSADPGEADYTLYVRSMRFSPQDAAALFAASRQDERRRLVAAQIVR